MDTWTSPWLPVLAAPFVGSFLGVLIARLPEGRPVVFARSTCDTCGHILSARDLLPLVSYSLTLGRCRHCAAAIGPFPLAVELAAVCIAAWAATAGGGIWWSCLFGWTLLALTWIDARTMLLPDVLTLPLGAAGLIATFVMDPESIADRVFAAAAGYGVLAGIAWLYRRLRHRDGLGLGDAKLLGAIGAWVGLAQLPFTLFVAACTGLAIAGGAALAGRRMTAATALPFGPCLAAAGWLAWLYGGAFETWLD